MECTRVLKHSSDFGFLLINNKSLVIRFLIMYYANVQYNNEFQLCFQIQIFMANCGPKITYSCKTLTRPNPFLKILVILSRVKVKGFFYCFKVKILISVFKKNMTIIRCILVSASYFRNLTFYVRILHFPEVC